MNNRLKTQTRIRWMEGCILYISQRHTYSRQQWCNYKHIIYMCIYISVTPIRIIEVVVHRAQSATSQVTFAIHTFLIMYINRKEEHTNMYVFGLRKTGFKLMTFTSVASTLPWNMINSIPYEENHKTVFNRLNKRDIFSLPHFKIYIFMVIQIIRFSLQLMNK